MKLAAVSIAALLSGCTTATKIAEAPPYQTYHSAKSREAVAECLLDRVSDSGLQPERTVANGITTITFLSADALIRPKPIIYLFTVRDEGGGSTTEVRRLGHSPMATAETCF